METNDSNIKPQQTGGLKLMTVFIAVLALHVVVIGGFTVYHLMSGGSADVDLTTTDKTHKDLKSADGSAIADGAAPDASVGDKGAPSTTPSDASRRSRQYSFDHHHDHACARLDRAERDGDARARTGPRPHARADRQHAGARHPRR